jgi:hypothetical protein
MPYVSTIPPPFLNFFFQVSMAVLLDNFVTASNMMDDKLRELELQERKALSQFQNPLQPLFFRLASRLAASGLCLFICAPSTNAISLCCSIVSLVRIN